MPIQQGKKKNPKEAALLMSLKKKLLEVQQSTTP